MRFRIITRNLGRIIGVLVMVALFPLFGLYEQHCPVFNGRICNNHGKCSTLLNKCECDVQWSGTACEYTPCPGYVASTGTVCSKLGVCSPFLTSADVPQECSLDWSKPSCVQHLKTVEPNLISCVCLAPYGGKACDLNQCPSDIQGRECGGNGNMSVGYIRNNTVTGSGCQCTSSFGFMQLKTSIPVYTISQIKDLNFFKRGLCGSVQISTLGKTEFRQNDYQCYCDSQHFGPVCEFGACPEVNGKICNDRGHKRLGSGFRENVTFTQQVPDNCHPICKSGYYLFENKCVPKPLISNSCPESRPYRCTSGECVPESPSYCAFNYEYGYHSLPHLIQPNCITNPAKCGIDAVTDNVELVSINPISIEFSDRLVYWHIQVYNASHYPFDIVVQKKYYTRVTEPGIYEGILPDQTRDEWELDAFIGSEIVQILPIGTHDVLLYKTTSNFNLELNSYVRIGFENVIQVTTIEYSEVIRTNSSNYLAVVVAYQIYINNDGLLVDYSVCQSNIIFCMWYGMEMQSASGTFLCKNGINGDYFLSGEVCAQTWDNVQQIDVAYRGRSRIAFAPDLINVLSERVLQILVLNRNTSSTIVEFKSQIQPLTSLFVNLTNLKFFTMEDIRLPCICPGSDDVLGNQTAQNVYYFNTRFEYPTVPGERGVFKYVLYGDVIISRGTLVSITPPLFTEIESLQNYEYVDSRLISNREYSLGRANCPFSSARSNVGGCDSIKLSTLTDGIVTCTCSFRDPEYCDCITEYGDSERMKNVFNASLYANTITCKYHPNIGQNIVPEESVDSSEFVKIFRTTQFPISIRGGNVTVFYSTDDGVSWLELQTELVIDEYRIVTYIGGDVLFFKIEFDSLAEIKWVSYGFPNMANKYILSSSNHEMVHNIEWNSNTYWESSDLDGDPYVIYQYNHTTYVTGILLEFDTLGVYIQDSLILSASAEVLVKYENSPWSVIDIVTDAVANGSSVWFLDVNSWIDAIQIRSVYKMRIRQLQVFTNQNCPNGIRIIPNDVEVSVLQLKSSLEYSNVTCTCVDSCIVNNMNVAGDGYCNDILFKTMDLSSPEPVVVTDIVLSNLFVTSIVFDNATLKRWNFFDNLTYASLNFSNNAVIENALWIYVQNSTNVTVEWNKINSVLVFECNIQDDQVSICQNVTVPGRYPDYVYDLSCAAGFDCTDCGSSSRKSKLSPEAKCVQIRNVSSLDFTLNELVDLVNVKDITIYVNITRTLSKIYVDCPWKSFCSDGTCQRYCPTALYNCDGDGCVRNSLLDKRYKCACEVGWGGAECTLHECLPGDPLTGLVDPHAWCAVNGPGPLKVKPPFSQVLPIKRGFSTSEIEVMNRRGRSQISNLDVRWDYVQSSHAPYGQAILRYYMEGNRMIYTTCPFLIRDKMGILRNVEDLVLSRKNGFPHEVDLWRPLMIPSGETAFITLSKVTEYDAAPYRCPNTGECVAHSTACDPNAVMCNGNGVGLVDGTCECYPEWQTWFQTDTETERARVPYNQYNPTQWGYEQELPLEMSLSIYRQSQCNVRNCSYVDCHIPRGCFPGTPELGFTDRLYTCQTGLYKGKCALDEVACTTGEVTEPLVCSGKGIPQRRDYRDEYYCACGSSNLGVNGVATELSHLVPNGFGGNACQYYECERVTKLEFRKFDPVTGLPYRNREGRIEPGRWFGGCNEPAGPSFDPSDTSTSSYQQWLACCPEGFDVCTKVVCDIRSVIGVGSDKSVCIPIEDCVGDGRTPQIYSCNGHGTALSDGTCKCDKTDTYGYTYNYKYFPYKGCFQKVRCQSSKINGRMCNRKLPCGSSDIEYWTDFPRLDYMEQQLPIIASLEGIAMTNKSLVLRLLPTMSQRSRLLYQSYVELALDVINDIRSLASDVCIYPNDTRENPFAMVPFSEARAVKLLPYGKIIEHASIITSLTIPNPVLVDNEIYLNCSDTVSSDSSGGPYVIQFNSLTKVKLVRIYQQGVGQIAIKYKNELGIDFTIPNDMTTSCTWLEWIFESVYEDFNFQLQVPFLYQNKCPFGEQDPSCREWMKSYCEEFVPNGVYRDEPQSIVLRGCSPYSRCCSALTQEVNAVYNLTLSWTSGTYLSEIQFYGYEIDIVPVMPSTFQAEIIEQLGQNTTCRDEYFFIKLFGVRGSSFLGNSITPYNYSQAFGICEARSGVLLSNNNELTGASVCSNGPCLTSGEEISTPKNPTREFFFSSLDRGCYHVLNSWYYVTSTYDADGTMWKSSQVVGQVPADTWYLEFMRLKMYGIQSTNAVEGRLLETQFTGLCREPTMYAKKLFFPGCWIGDVPCAGTAQPTRNYCETYRIECAYSCTTNVNPQFIVGPYLYWASVQHVYYSQYTGNCVVDASLVIPRPTPDPFSLTLNQLITLMPSYAASYDYNRANSDTALYWTNEPICKIILYNDEYCGANIADMDPFGTVTAYDNRNVPYYEYVITSANYDAFYFRFNLNNMVFNKCTRGGSSCPGFGTLMAGFNIKSIAVQGPCVLSLNQQGNPNAEGSWGYFRENDYYTTPRFRVLRRATSNLNDLRNGYTGTTLIPKGCRMNIFDTAAQNELPKSVEIGYFYVIPDFSSDFVRHEIHSESRQTTGNDQFSMGYLDHPYMCTHHQIEIIAKVVTFGQVYGGRTGFVDISSNPSIRLDKNNPIIVMGSLRLSNSLDAPLNSANYRFCRDIFAGFKSCPEAIERRPQFNWKWKTRYYDNVFPDYVDKVRRHTSPNVPVETNIFVDYFEPMQTSRLIDLAPTTALPRVYARMISFLKATDYEVKFRLDKCLALKYISPAKYEYQPTVCSRLTMPILCTRDYYPYTSPTGLLCDVCGPLSRINRIEAGVKPIDKFPLANAALFPFEHMIKDAYLSGDLLLFINQYENEDAHYDYMMGYLLTKNPGTLVLAFPQVRRWLMEEYSTRPVFTSAGETENPDSWVDFRFSSWFPYTCPKVTSVDTGISRYRCSTSLESCAYSNNDTAQMLVTDIPKIITSGIVSSISDTRCGLVLNPKELVTTDYWGFTVNQEFTLLEIRDSIISVEMIDYNVTFENTGKRQYVIPRTNKTYQTGVNLYTQVICNSECIINIDVTTYETNYVTPPRRYLNLINQILSGGSLTELSLLNAVIADPELTQLRWRIECVSEQNCIATLYPIVVSSNDTLDACENPITTYTWKELPRAVDSAAPEHECIFDDGGYCSCSKSSPFNGPTCDWPSIITVYGKQTCGGYGAVSGVSYPNKYTVNEYGIYHNPDENEYECKCNNPGMSFYTRLLQIIDEPLFVVRYDDVFGLSLYYYVEVSSDISIPVSHELNLVRTVCASESSILPSFIGGDEINTFVISSPEPGIQVDLGIVDGLFKWVQRGVDLMTVNTSLPLVNIDTLGLASITNLNNLLYNQPGSLGNPLLVDGYSNVTISSPNTFDVTFPDPSDIRNYIIEIVNGTGVVFTTSPLSACTDNGDGSWLCLNPLTITIDVTRASEIRMFYAEQTTRVLDL